MREAVAAVTELETAWAATLGDRRIRSLHRALSTLALRFGAGHIRLPER